MSDTNQQTTSPPPITSGYMFDSQAQNIAERSAEAGDQGVQQQRQGHEHDSQHSDNAATEPHRDDSSVSDSTRAPSSMRSAEQPPTKKAGSSDDVDKSTAQEAKKSEDTTLEAYKKRIERQHRLIKSRGHEHATPALSVAWSHLSVRGLGGKDDLQFAPTVGSILSGPYAGFQDKKRKQKLSNAREQQERDAGEYDEGLDNQSEKQGGKGKGGKKGKGLGKGERYLIKDFSGVVKAGEMMLVVGRPGSGCTTFLKTLADLTQGFAGVDGDVKYGSLDWHDKRVKAIKAQIIFNSEEDIHFPQLQVGRTLDYALHMKTPARHSRPLKEDEATVPSAQEFDDGEKAQLLKSLGLEHTHSTRVGDAYVRGVSGGEKKRTSIAEVLSQRASVQCWDNATRGLDANTALEYTKIMRTLTDTRRNASIVSLYQAGNGIYDLFDKVTVIAEGQLLYYGPRSEAQKYMEDLGFEIVPGANVADFLTGVTVKKERKIRQGFEGKVPDSVTEFAKLYRKSEMFYRMQDELEEHLSDTAALEAETERTMEVTQREKHKYALKREPYTTSFFRQTKVAIVREYQQRWEDKATFWARQGTTLLQALVAGSIFYNAPQNTGGLFIRGGVMFLAVLFPSLISLSETTAAFEGRAILAKHKAFSTMRPSSVVVAQTVADFPILGIQIIIFSAVLYNLSGLKQEAGPFFFFTLIVYFVTLSTMAFFRWIGSLFGTFQNASKVSGLMFSILVTYAGYIIPTPQMVPWFAWIRWINPMYYAFESLMINEFLGQQFACVPTQLAPYGPAYPPGSPQGCAIAGAAPGSTTLDGETYINTALSFYEPHKWRNLGVIIAYWVLFVGLTMWATERLPAAGSTKAFLLYKRGGGGKFIKSSHANGAQARDEEEGSGETQAIGESGHSNGNGVNEKQVSENKKQNGNGEVASAETVFTWKNLTYTVQAGGKDLKLLDDVQGFCKPGELTALMGSSGAGKTTLMDVLAQRKTEGEINGEILINGSALPVSFQRTTGYCEQQDVHLPQATVREALEFSALLRQPRNLSDKEKLAYVDVIIELLELHDIEDALVGVPGAGLGVEARKRLTIGVELVAKPTLLFLDEPTSGLDGQSSYLIVTFLRKLAAAGQSVLCTIHQPAASIFAEFDRVLLLKKGGRTVYFGKVKELPDYFAKEGVDFPKEVNPAEFMIDVVSGDLAKDRDWADVWLKSDAHKSVVDEIEQLKKDNQHKDASREDDGYQFASPVWTQMKLVTKRASVQLYRDVDYVQNKFFLHVGAALFNGFSFWMLGNTYQDLQNRLFTIFQFIFVAPGVIAQTQPKFILNRDIFETREKKAKLYSWQAFIAGEIISEIPYLLVCAIAYWACWYPVVGFTMRGSRVILVIVQMCLYEGLYTGLGQMIAAYSPNPVFASLVNPIVIGVLTLSSGVLIPYSQIQVFWRYWLYYLSLFNYLMGGLLVPTMWDVEVRCAQEEFGRFSPPAGQTCGEYMAPFLSMNPGYVDDPASTTECAYCIYSKGSEYLQSLNLLEYYYGWRDILITLLFVLSSYGFVFIFMKLRTKQTKTAK